MALIDKLVAIANGFRQSRNITHAIGLEEMADLAAVPLESDGIVPSGTKNISHNGIYNVATYADADVQVVPILEERTASPTKEQQVFTPSEGKDGISKFTVEKISDQYIVPTGKKTINSNGVHEVSEYAQVDVNISSDAPKLQTKELTPTESKQTVNPDEGFDGFSSVSINPISSTYIGSAVTKKGAQAYTPSKEQQVIFGGQYLTGNQTINPIPDNYVVPSGTKNITENGTHDVAGFQNVTVDVPTSGGGGTNYPDGRNIYYTGRV